MVIVHNGNNWYIGWKSQGDAREQVNNGNPSNNSIYQEMDTGIISQFQNGVWLTSSYGTKSDALAASLIATITKTNIGLAYVDVFPALYSGVPIPIDTTGYSKIGVAIMWNKNGGNGRHDARLVNHTDIADVLVSTEAMPTGLPTGMTKNYNIDIPPIFENFRGDIRLQAKSTVANNSPIFDGIILYLIR